MKYWTIIRRETRIWEADLTKIRAFMISGTTVCRGLNTIEAKWNREYVVLNADGRVPEVEQGRVNGLQARAACRLTEPAQQR
jgi:hypothetical protein